MRFSGFLCTLLTISFAANAQDTASNWSLFAGHEASYTGNNGILHVARVIQETHIVEAGVNYNFSDGFANNPVLGIGFSYGYKVLANKSWEATVGIDYRRQKPIAILNIQTFMYATKVQYNFTKRLSIYTRLGYGVALERSRSAGSFTQSNNISGSINTGCVFQL